MLGIPAVPKIGAEPSSASAALRTLILKRVGSLRSLTLLERFGGHFPHSCLTGTTRKPASTSSRPQAGPIQL